MSTPSILRQKTLVGDSYDAVTNTADDSDEEDCNLRDLSNLFAKCQRLSNKLKGDQAGSTESLRLELFTGSVLKDYQEKGVSWVVNLQKHGLNGILADEMGLGKTAQSIAIVCHMISSGARDPILILGPLSTIPNWKKEFNRFAPTIPVIQFHGDRATCADLLVKMRKKVQIKPGLSIYPVVIAPYHTFMSHSSGFKVHKWSLLVFDEASVIKNEKSKINKLTSALTTKSRLLLTGTPMQNNLQELFNLLHFILPQIFQTYDPFRDWIQEINARKSRGSLGNTRSLDLVSQMHKIIAPFFLRRTKQTANLKLPPKKHVIVYCPMTMKQKILYEATLRKAEEPPPGALGIMGDYPEVEGRTMTRRLRKELISSSPAKRQRRISPPDLMDDDSGFSSISQGESVEAARMVSEAVCGSFTHTNILTLLRSIVAHPWIVDKKFDYYHMDRKSLLEVCGKLQVFDLLLTDLLKRGHKVIVCSQFVTALEIIAFYLDLSNEGYFMLSGSTKFEDRQESIDAFNDEASPQKVFLLSTRAGGMGINLTGADTVIFYDTDWNPQMDLQAADRCHRIGQTKPVVVYRLIGKETVDEKILESASNKRRLEKLLIDSGELQESTKAGKALRKDLLTILKAVDWDAALDHDYLDPGKIANLANREYVFRKCDDKDGSSDGL